MNIPCRRVLDRKWLLLCFALLLNGCGKPDPQASPGDHLSTNTMESAKDPQLILDAEGTLVLPETTRQAMAIKTAAAEQKSFGGTHAIPFQIFREADEKRLPGLIYRSGFAYAMALLPEASVFVKPGDKTTVQSVVPGSPAYPGKVVAIDTLPSSAGHQKEIVLEIADAAHHLELTQSLAATFSTGSVAQALVVPASAVLNATSGTFVYVQTPTGYKRTEIKTGDATVDEIQILEGLRPGDSIVLSPVQTLWLTELKLRNGGGE